MSYWVIPPEYLSILPKIRVLLMGSFHTKLGLPKLESLKGQLIQNGLRNCRITKDFNSPPRMLDETEASYNLRKSEYWMRHADIFVFIFFPRVDNASVGIELEKALSQIPGSTWRTILAYHEKAPSLIAALGIRFQPEISVVPFSDKVDLNEQINGNIIRLLARFYSSVSIRPDGEWEYSSAS